MDELRGCATAREEREPDQRCQTTVGLSDGGETGRNPSARARGLHTRPPAETLKMADPIKRAANAARRLIFLYLCFSFAGKKRSKSLSIAFGILSQSSVSSEENGTFFFVMPKYDSPFLILLPFFPANLEDVAPSFERLSVPVLRLVTYVKPLPRMRIVNGAATLVSLLRCVCTLCVSRVFV